ncbi:(Fe-S)-binding protein [Luteitalea sp. TBR-22]|uniref:(Fe-S)-binding protein n=1 Tax=Luteitalea sp. TBR-22 TaxID=2802971 RepID=UPI001EF457A0|nr:(Fe-S)-binding protein [Luteitalea sp. TBR-22]
MERVAGTPGGRPTRVQLLVTCLVDHFSPDTAAAVVRVLEREGLEVIVPGDQTCCGQPAANAGARADAAAMARHTIALLERDPAPVVVPSGSCTDMLVHQAPALLADDPDWSARAAAVASRTYEFTQFLVDVLGVTRLAPSAVEGVSGTGTTGTLAYHACCHGLRGIGIDAQPRALLAGVAGAAVVPLPEHDTCCGFGGLFAVKLPDISGAMLDRKCRQIAASGADTVVVTDVSCAMHIQGGLDRKGQAVKVQHVADVIAGGLR